MRKHARARALELELTLRAHHGLHPYLPNNNDGTLMNLWYVFIPDVGAAQGKTLVYLLMYMFEFADLWSASYTRLDHGHVIQWRMAGRYSDKKT